MKSGGIPVAYLTKIGIYKNITLHGISGITVLTADCEDAVNKHITDIHNSIHSIDVKIVGIDIKQIKTGDEEAELLVFYSGICALIIHLDYMKKVPKPLDKFLNDANICFVSPTELFPYGCLSFPAVKVGDLAARVLTKAGFKTKGVAEIAGEIGVSYINPSNNASNGDILVDSGHPRILSNEQVKVAISDAYACYQIGYKLLSSL